MSGAHGRYLEIDLATRQQRDVDIPRQWRKLHVGGYGIAHRYLLEALAPGVSAWAEENVLVFATGPLQGSGFPGGGRHVVAGKSPKTGMVCDSYSGGYFAHELGRSGYDGIAFRGKSEDPVYLLVVDGKAELRDAADLWGKDVRETEDTLKHRHGRARVASIGRAGENRVKSACIVNDYNRVAGRPGFGAVMGDKRLKAVVVEGNVEKPFHDRDRVKQLGAEYARRLMEDPGPRGFGEVGTISSVEPLNELGILPTRNFLQGTFAGASRISGNQLAATILVGRETCTGCPVRCKRQVRTQYRGETINDVQGGLEYESVAALGSLCLVDDLDALSLANQKCNNYGLDTISTGVSIAFAMEASERGLTNEKIPWGDASSLLRLIDEMALRRGLGGQLADGIDALAAEWGADFAVQIKGVEVPLHDPRGKVGLAISYATSPRGATHLEACHDTMVDGLKDPIEELGICKGKDRFDWERAPEICKAFEDLMSFTNSLVMCSHISWGLVVGSFHPYKFIREALAAMTGDELSAEEMMLVGERNYALRKALACRDGYARASDGIPQRLKQALPAGNSAERPIPDAELQNRIDEYYSLRGFVDGCPTADRLRSLGLESTLPDFRNK